MVRDRHFLSSKKNARCHKARRSAITQYMVECLWCLKGDDIVDKTKIYLVINNQAKLLACDQVAVNNRLITACACAPF